VTGGGALFKDFVVDLTARSRRACAAPGNVFGKTNTPEMGLAASTEPRLFGPTRNPWSLTHSSGGSSGGSAAVAAGVVPMARRMAGARSGSRLPAAAATASSHACAQSMGPDAGEGWGGASVGRGHAVVRDSAAARRDVGPYRRPYWAPPPARPFLEEVGRDPGRRIAIATRPWSNPSIRNAPRRRSRPASCATSSAITWRPPDVDAGELGDATLIVSANIRATLEARAAALGRELAAGDVERLTWARAVDGHTARAADYARSIGVVHRIGRVVARFFTRYDLLLSPTMCRPPYPLGVLDLMTNDVERYTEAILGSIGFTALFFGGSPAMSCPAWSGRACVGVHFAARLAMKRSFVWAQLEAPSPGPATSSSKI
jgi:amidase/6-aminohexanoate-cyclic-dimer hydrolase